MIMLYDRINVCSSCPFFMKVQGVCEKCACPIGYLTTDPKATCPEGKW